jgi:hypothetical protein
VLYVVRSCFGKIGGWDSSPFGPGRRLGSRNKRTQDVINIITSNGYKDPLLVLSDLCTHSEDEHIRATASNMLAPYLHSKMGLTPARIYLEHEVHLPHPSPSKLDQIRENITYLTNLKLSAKIDTASADSLILDQTKLHDSIFEEMKLLYSQDVAPEVSPHHGRPDLPPRHRHHHATAQRICDRFRRC